MHKLLVPLLLPLWFGIAAEAAGPRITGVEIPSQLVSAGGTLAVDLTVETEAGLDLGSGSGAIGYPTGNVPANPFPNGTGDGKPLLPLGGGRYRVSDLQVSPFVYTGPQELRFILSAVYVIDRKGQTYRLKITSETDEFYIDEDWNLTDVPVVSFTVRFNPNADREGPKFTSFRIEKPVVRRGEEVRFYASVADAHSGMQPYWSWVAVTENIFPTLNAGQTWAENIGGTTYLLSGLKVLPDAPLSSEEVAVNLVQMLDRAGNYGQLTLKDPEDEFYWYSSPITMGMTDIPVVRFRIVE